VLSAPQSAGLTFSWFQDRADHTTRLSSVEPLEPAELTEQAVRLLTGVVMLLRQHRVNKRGQCPIL
jgi:hypothetical protein